MLSRREVLDVREATVGASRLAVDSMLRVIWNFPQMNAAFARLRDARRRVRAFNRMPSEPGAPLAQIALPLPEISEDQLLQALRAFEDLERALKPAVGARRTVMG
ncbi:MAG: hypothetical protein AB7E79_09620 [Rhodospirillaceae bacterium]